MVTRYFSASNTIQKQRGFPAYFGLTRTVYNFLRRIQTFFHSITRTKLIDSICLFSQIGGLTGLHTNLSVAFALISAEDEDSFFWALSQLKEMAEHHSIPFPLVIMSNYDKAFKNAARKVFEASQQLCVWHILKNVIHNIKQNWEGTLGDFAGGMNENSRISGVCHDDDESNPNEEDSHIQTAIDKSLSAQEKIAKTTFSEDLTPDVMLQDFRAVLYANDEPEFRENWKDFQSRYETQDG